MRQIVVTVGPISAASANAICLSQTPSGAGSLTLNGALVSGGVAALDTQRQVLITCAGVETGKTFVVTGTDGQGRTISDTLAGPSASTVASTRYFKTVTSITISAAAAGAITVGTNSVAASNPIPLDIHGRPEISLQAVVSGTVNWTIQQTLDTPYTTSALNWFDHIDSNLVSQTVNRQGNYAYVPAATRIVLNSGSGSVTYTVVQAGITG